MRPVRAILLGLRDALRSGRHAWKIDALGCGSTREAGFTDELIVHVFLQEGSCWAQSIQTEFYNDLIGFD